MVSLLPGLHPSSHSTNGNVRWEILGEAERQELQRKQWQPKTGDTEQASTEGPGGEEVTGLSTGMGLEKGALQWGIKGLEIGKAQLQMLGSVVLPQNPPAGRAGSSLPPKADPHSP